MASDLRLTARAFVAAVLSVVMVASAFGVHTNGAAPASPPPVPSPDTTYTAFPSTDPDDGKFMAVAGEGQSTLAGLAVIAYIGVPAGQTSFEVDLFDGDTGGAWDTQGSAPTLNYVLYRDPLKNGTSSSVVAQWTSNDATDDSWYTRTFSTDNAAKAPSGNYFYRFEANWADPTSTSFNNFKIRTTGQISLKAGQDFGFAAGPQNPPPGPDPCVGSGDPNPGDQNDPGANSYNGDWSWYFYVPIVQTSISFRDGDFDRADDPNSPGLPPDDNFGPGGDCVRVSPSVYYTVTDPESHVYTNNNPSGNQEWEDFVIGPDPGDNVVINYPLQPGLWRLHVVGLDAHNFVVLRASREVYSTPDPPLTVNPEPRVEPDHTLTTKDHVTVEYGHNVTNEGAPDSFDLKATSAHGWATRIYHDANGNGRVDPGEPLVTLTPTLGTNESYPLVVQVDVPTLSAGTNDVTTVLASSRSEWAVQDDAKDTTHVLVNRPPVANAGGPYAGYEGSPIAFDASRSTDPDGDNLTFRWDYNGDGSWDTGWSSNPTGTYTWGDDWRGTARVEVSDGNLTDLATANVTVSNVAPTIQATVIPTGNEADTLTFRAQVTDPGSDDLLVAWSGSCTGWSLPRMYYNDPSVGPDPYPSPNLHPRNITDSQGVVCGDNGLFAWSVRVTDDDGGVTTTSGTFAVGNLPPSLTVSPPAAVTVDEGTQVTLNGTATDPGSDDLSFLWEWQYGATDSHVYYNDGVGPDPPNSPNGTYPFTASDSSSFTYGDDGVYNVSLRVTDDDGGFTTYTTTITVVNVPPTVVAGADQVVNEASPVSVSFAFSDPGFDQPWIPTWENFTAMIDWGYGPPEAASVLKFPGRAGVPTTGFVNATHVYGDNGVFPVTAAVCDDDGGCGSATLHVTVNNVAPTIPDVQAYVVANVTLRVAGEKWHDVRMDLTWDGNVTGSVRVVRMPGSPDRQSATIEGAHLQLLGNFSITLYYTPDDDPVNGQPNGANPVWVIIQPPGEDEIRLHHTFNVQHPDTWTWTIDDLRPYLVGRKITFDATAHDVGSDDLTFAWAFGDGGGVSTIYYNNGVSPDPYPSPEVNPITAHDVQTHAFVVAGTYTITLTVTDDDGGTVSRVFTLQVGG